MASIGSAELSDVKAIVWSSQFNDDTADVIYISSDGVRFRIHSVFLRAHSEVLAPEEGVSLKDPVHLPEPASVLDLLFNFLYPDRPPVVKLELEFDTLMSLSEAAAKYRVFPAMYVCSQQLRTVLPSHAVEILAHAYKHRFPVLVKEAAVYAIDQPLVTVVDLLPSEIHRTWLDYHEKWTRAQMKALAEHLPSHNPDVPTIRRIASRLSSLSNLDATFGASSSSSQWHSSIESDVAAIPKFTDCLGWKGDDANDTSLFKECRECPLVVIETSDGAGHPIAADILGACTSNIGNQVNGKIKVSESSATIGLLLRFVTPVQYPDLKGLQFLDLKDLALAAEKYSVRQARGLCRILMREAVKNHPYDVFHYAAEADYLDILDLSAPLVLGPINAFHDVIKRLPSRFVSAWILYYHHWQDAVRLYLETVIKEGEKLQRMSCCETVYGVCGCQSNATFHYTHMSPILSRLMLAPGELQNLDSIIAEQRACTTARQTFDKCKVVAANAISSIPTLSSFL